MSCCANRLGNFSKCFMTTHTWHSHQPLNNLPIIFYWHCQEALNNPAIILDLHSDQALNNPPIILEALVEGRRSIDKSSIALSEIKAQRHGIYLNKGAHDAGLCEYGHDTNKACGQGIRVSSFLFFYPVIPSKYHRGKQIIYGRGWGWGVHFIKQSNRQRGILLFTVAERIYW